MFTVTVNSFKEQFDRGQFAYGTSLPDIRDKDITNAIDEANAVFNQGLYPTDPDAGTLPLLYLTAHFLQLDTEASESGGQSKYNQTGRSADGLSESVSIPEWMQDGEFAFYTTTYYGQKYLMLSKPYMDGAVYSVSGGTTP
jgi:hypothetical protein